MVAEPTKGMLVQWYKKVLEKTIFRKNIFVDKYDGDLSIIDKHINHILEFDKGKHITNRGGYHSNNITFGFEDLLKFIHNCFLKIDLNVSLDNFWININKGTHYNIPHIHGVEGIMSVVYYHKVCCENSPLVFSQLVPQINFDEYTLVPENQMLVFFDANIPHKVLPCDQEDHERISLAFNYRMLT